MQPNSTYRSTFFKGAYYVFLFFVVSGFSYIAFAVPPATPYTPGATLDPGCVPGGVNCTVSILPSGSTGEIQFNASGALSSYVNFVWDSTNFRLGIGTTSPYAKLSVVGEVVGSYFTATSTTATSTFAWGVQANALNITSTTATSTFANGINVGTGCFAINGTCVGGAGGSLTGSGAANKVAFWTSGTNLSNNTNFHWDDTNARLGIGTTSPYAMLSVAGQVVGQYFTATSTTATSTFGGAFSVGSTTPDGSTFFSIGTSSPNLTVNKSTGYVGIGTASPFGPLHITSDISNYSVLFSEASTDVSGVNIALRKSRGTHASPAIAEGGDILGSIGVYPYNSSGFNLVGSMRFEAEGTPAAGQQPSSRIVFSTQPISLAGMSPTERMRIDSLGNVGIGTTSPYAKLSVVGETVSAYYTATTTATSTFAGGLRIGTGGQPGALSLLGNATSTFAQGVDISAGCFAINGTCVGGAGGSLTGSGAANKVAFWTSGTNLSNNTNFHWDDTNARLGIGTTSPYAMLSVAGQVVGQYFTATSTTATSTFANHISIGSAKEYRINGIGILTRDASSAIILGDLTGNARGSFALDLQSGRSGVAVVASGADSSAVGADNTAAGTNASAFGSGNTVSATFFNSSAFGRANTASNGTASAFGHNNLASGDGSSAFGNSNTASGLDTVAFGVLNNVSGSGASAFGSNISNSIDSSTMIGPSNTAKLTILSGGNAGFGTSTPYSRLSVWGNGTTASTTFEIANNASTTLAKFLDNGTGYFLGNIGIGTTSPWRKLSVTGTVGFDGLTTSVTGNAVCVTANKEITDAGAANCVPSSIRFKENITVLPVGTALDSLRKMAVKTFTYKKEFQMDEQEHIGLIAEDLESIDPRLVVYNKNDSKPWSIHFEEVTGLLVQATQELDKRISALEANVAAIRGSTSEWSIDEKGKLVVEELEVKGNAKIGSPSRRSGVTLYDEQTGTPYCLTISGGVTKTISGECGLPAQSVTQPITIDNQQLTTTPPVPLDVSQDGQQSMVGSTTQPTNSDQKETVDSEQVTIENTQSATTTNQEVVLPMNPVLPNADEEEQLSSVTSVEETTIIP